MNIVTKTLAALLLGTCALAGQAATITYFHNDVSGTPLLATDQTGKEVWRESYRPYGDRLNMEDDSGGNSIGFHGKPFDPNTGLSYMGARYYHPTVGRFMGIDPAPVVPDELQSFNRYAYANNNPYRYVDPDGNSPIDVAFLAWDLGKLGLALYSGVGVGGAFIDVGLSVVGVVSPVPGTGQALKMARATEHVVEAVRAGDHLVDAAKGVVAAKGVGTATKESGNVIHVTSSGVALPPGPKYKIPEHYVQNPNPKASGNYGEVVNGKYRERLAIHPDHGSGRGSHYHLDGKGSTHNSPRPGNPDPGFTPQ